MPAIVRTAEAKKCLPTFIRKDDRGCFIEAASHGLWESLICGRMKRLAWLGDHYHRETEVFFFLTSGRAKVTVLHVASGKRCQCVLNENEGIVFKPLESHRIHFLKNSAFIMMKSRRYDPSNPDIFRHPVTEEAHGNR